MSANAFYEKLIDHWKSLTSPSARLQSAHQRHEAGLLAAILVVLLLIALVMLPVWVVKSVDKTAAVTISAAASAGVILAYVLSRTRHYRWGVWIILILFLSLIVVILLTSPRSMMERMYTLNFLTAVICWSSIFLTIRITLLITGGSFAAVLVLFFVSDVPFSVIFSFLGFLAVISTLVIVAATIRRRSLRLSIENEQRLDAFFTQSLDGFFYMTLDEPVRWDDSVDKEAVLDYVLTHQRMTQTNDAMLAQYRATREQFLGRTLCDFFAHDPAQGRTVARQLLDAGRLHVETEERRFDGTPIWIEGDYVCMYDAAGRITGQFGFQRDVTERILAERALRESELRFRSLFEQTHDAVFILDMEGNHKLANHRAAEMLGYTPDEMQGLSVRDLSAEQEASQRVVERLRSGEHVPHYERLFRKKNGEILPVEITVELVRDTDGKPLHIQSVVRDISQRKLAEEALRQSEERFSKAFYNSPVPMVITTSDPVRPRYVEANEAYLQLVGYTWDELKDTTVLDVGIAIPDERHESRMLTLEQKRHYRVQEAQIRNRAGEIRDVLISAQRIYIGGEECDIELLLDTTDLKRMQIELEESKTRLQGILESIQDIVWSTSLTERRFIYINPAAESIYGRPTAEFFEDADLWFKLIYPDDQERVGGLTRQFLRDGQREWVYRIVRPDGEIRWLRDRAWLVTDADGNAVRIDGVATDITARQIAQEQAFALEVAKERVKVLAHFAQNASHELRTPLAVINSSLYLMIHTTHDDKRQEYAEKARQHILSITRLLDMLLVMTKLDAGIPLNCQAANINNLIAQVIAAAQTKLARQGVSAELMPDTALPQISVDADWLEQALDHLLDNAVRFTPGGGSVQIRTYRQGSHAVIDVRDTGSGISAEALPHIFERFWRQDEAHSTPGFGLGLPIAQKIVEQHGGRIEVESTPGEGSTFRVFLRVSASQPVASPSAGRVRVLVVDDEPGIGAAIVRLLPECDVTTCTSGEEALLRINAGERFDVIFSDLLMPGVNGQDLLTQLEREVPDQAARFVFLTGGGFDGPAGALLASAPRPCIDKPFEVQQLREAIARITRR